MKTKYTILLICLASFLFCEDIGKLTVVSGKVNIQKSGQSSIAKKGMTVAEGACIITASSGKAVITLDNGDTISVQPGTRMVINQNTVKNRAGKAYNLSVNSGSLRCKLSKLSSSGSSFQIYTPNSVAGVRGTDFSVATGLDGSSSVSVSDGKVNVKGESGDVNVGAKEKVDAVLGDSKTMTAEKSSGDDEEDISKWLEQREDAVKKDPAGSMDRMQAHLAKVEKDAAKLAGEAEKAAEAEAGKDKEQVDATQTQGLALNDNLNQSTSANDGIMENAKKIAEKYSKDKSVQKKLSGIERINKSIDSYNSRVDAALGRLDAKIEAALKRIDDSWNNTEDRINKRFGDFKDEHKMDMDMDDGDDDKFKIK